MKAGQIEQVGAPLELYDRPASRFVAEFLGSPSMNMLPGTLSGQGQHPALALDDGTLVPLAGIDPGAAPGSRVVLGVRPEHLSLSRDGAPGFEIDIDVIEPTGSDTLLIGKVAGLPVTCEADGRPAVRSGDRVALQMDPAHLHFFDEDSGRRIDTARPIAAE